MRCSPERRRGGFTLIELLVVIAIIATLASVVAPALFSNVGEARRATGRAQIDVLVLALDTYRLDIGDYPSAADGLQALRVAPSNEAQRARWRGPYLRQEVPRDPWDRPWVYRLPGAANPTSFDLYSLGRDGQIGGTGEDEDLTSWRGAVTP